MRILIPAAAALLLAACSQQQVAATQAKLAVACQVDGVLQPVGAAALASAGGAAAAAAALDTGVVHPAIQAACASLHGVPVVTAVAAAPVAAAVPAK